MTYKLNVNYVGFLNSRNTRKSFLKKSRIDQTQCREFLETRHQNIQNPTFPDITTTDQRSPQDLNPELSNNSADFNDTFSPDENIYMGSGVEKPDIPDITNDFKAFSPEKLVQICRERLIPLRLDPDGTLIVGSNDLQPDLAEALDNHRDAIAGVITAQHSRLCIADEYEDAEFPCDHSTTGSYGEQQAWCDLLKHSDEEILNRWQAIKEAAREAEIDRLTTADATTADDEEVF